MRWSRGGCRWGAVEEAAPKVWGEGPVSGSASGWQRFERAVFSLEHYYTLCARERALARRHLSAHPYQPGARFALLSTHVHQLRHWVCPTRSTALRSTALSGMVRAAFQHDLARDLAALMSQVFDGGRVYRVMKKRACSLCNVTLLHDTRLFSTTTPPLHTTTAQPHHHCTNTLC